MALVINDRVKETSTTAGTGTLDLAGAVTGFVTFVAGIGDTNTTYYAIFEQGTANWEVGLGTVTDAATDTLARTTVISNSLGSTAKISFGGTLDVFCTLPASKAVFGKQEGTNFTDSLLVGHATTGTLDAATGNTGAGIDCLDAITSGDSNTAVGYLAATALTEANYCTIIGRGAGTAITTGSYCTAIGKGALQSNQTAASQTAVGYQTLKDSTGSSNTGFGMRAGDSVVDGTFNLFLGKDAGQNITSGSGNVMIGGVDADSATGDQQLKIAGNNNSSTVTWISGESTGNTEIAVNWNPSLSTTGKAFVMGF